MSRPLRLEYPGSLWHVTARGNAKQDIFRDGTDRHRFIERLGQCVERFKWILTAYVLMRNHIHLVVQLTTETLSRGMHWLNGTYTQDFNRRHDRVGHLFQGRFKGLLVDRDSYSLEVLRYVVLNPVRARIVSKPEEFEWSSHRAVLGIVAAPKWLAIDDVLVQFAPNRDIARSYYRSYVDAAIGIDDSPWKNLVGQIYLGSPEWVDSIRKRINIRPRPDDYGRVQRLIGQPMASVVRAVAVCWGVDEDVVRRGRGSVVRMAAAWVGTREALLTQREVAAGLRLGSPSHVRALADRFERELDRNAGLRACMDRCLATLRGESGESPL